MSKKTEFDKLWNYNDPAGTHRKFSEMLPEVKSSGDKDLYLQLLTQLARTQGLQMKFDEAHKILDEVEDELNDKSKLAELRYYLERGRTFNSSKVKDKARELFLKAFDAGKQLNEDNYTVDAAHMMAIVETGEESLRWNETAMKIAEDSQDEDAKRWLGSLYNNTGWTYFDMKDYSKALEIFEKCRQWHEDRKTGQGLFIAKWSIAKTLRMLGRTNEALDIQNALKTEIEENKAEDDGYVYEELGECYLEKGDKKEAGKYFKKAYELLSKDIWLAENEKERLARIKELSA